LHKLSYNSTVFKDKESFDIKKQLFNLQRPFKGKIQIKTNWMTYSLLSLSCPKISKLFLPNYRFVLPIISTLMVSVVFHPWFLNFYRARNSPDILHKTRWQAAYLITQGVSFVRSLHIDLVSETKLISI
jgi:hypothetical protein